MYLKYLQYIIRHKWFVFLEACKLGIPGLGIIHDLSKLLPSEFVPYTKHFYGPDTHHGDGSHTAKGIQKGRDETGYYKPTDTGDLEFDFAWLLHQKRNRHHWQWWILPEDDGGIKILDIPLRYRKEMLADWYGAGRAQGTPNTQAWYIKNKGKMQLSQQARDWIESRLRVGHSIERASE